MTQYIAPRLTMTHRTSEGEGVQIKRLTPRHYALMDHILAHPTSSLGDIATEFGVTQAWLSTVYHSDLFQHVLNTRRQDITQDFDRTTVAKLRRIADKGLDNLSDALSDEETPLAMQQSITEMALKGLGVLGQKAQPAAVVINNTQNNTTVHSKADLSSMIEQARARILNKKAQPILINQQPVEISDESSDNS